MLVMKLVMLMVLLPVFAFAMPTYSQKQIKMEVQDVSLEQVLKELHAQSGYYILYRRNITVGFCQKLGYTRFRGIKFWR